MFHVNVTDRSCVMPEFYRLVDSITTDSDLMEEAMRYSKTCRRKYHKIMTDAITWVTDELTNRGIRTLVQSSYSADVYVDDPGNVDVDIVVPVDSIPTVHNPILDKVNDYNNVVSCLLRMGFFFSETRNADLDRYRHHVFTTRYENVTVEVKIREWGKYQHNLYLVHDYLDKLPENVRVAWRYIRGRVMYAPAAISKNIKFLWYMVGAIGAEIDMKEYPLNIFY